MAMPLIDAHNDVVDFKMLGVDVATPSNRSAARQVQTYFHPADNVTPGKLAAYMRMAEFSDPQWLLAYFEDMLERDPIFRACMEQRMLAASQWPMVVRPASKDPLDVEIAQFCQEIVDQGGFREAMPTIQDAVPKGFSVHWIDWKESRDLTGRRRWWPRSLEWKDPRWFLFGDDGKKLMLRGDDNKPQPLPPYGYLKHVHRGKAGLPIRGGVAKVCAWYYMFKNYAIKDWLTFAETFWIPFIIGRLPQGVEVDSDQGRALSDMLNNLGHDLRILLGQNQSIEVLDVDKTSSPQAIQQLLSYIDQSYARAILGQLQTTDSSTAQHSLAKAVIGKEMLYETLVSDDVRQRNSSVLRDVLIPACRLNYPQRPKYPTVESDNEVEVDRAQGPVVSQTIKDVASGFIPRDSGIGFLRVYARLTEEQAETVLGSAGIAAAAKPAPVGAEGGGSPAPTNAPPAPSSGAGQPVLPRGAQQMRLRTNHLYDQNGNLISSETLRV